VKRRDPVTPQLREAVLLRDRGFQERFWAKVWKPDDFPCWLWIGTRSIGGRYGAIKVGGRMRPAHRISWEMVNGPIPAGLELDHLCRITACVRPDHLEPVTHAENMRRGDGWAGVNARKIECERHHISLVQIASGRICRECRREANTRYRRRLGASSHSEGSAAMWARRTPEQKAEISRKVWETRRRNAAS
jgi:hypothetical protein